MLKSVKALTGLNVQATDGEIGKVYDVYFDDERWTVRYLIMGTGGWLRGRKVLVSPYAVSRLDFDADTVMVDLTRQQVEGSPDTSLSRGNRRASITATMAIQFTGHIRLLGHTARCRR